MNGVTPANLMISWDPMPLNEHNGPGFYYRVHWKKEKKGAEEETGEEETDGEEHVHIVIDWNQDHYIAEVEPTYARYRIQVEAANDVGVSNSSASWIHGWSGECEPTQAPTDFELVETGTESVILHWNSVPRSSINGNSKGYMIHIWNDVDGETKKEEVVVDNLSTSETKVELRPESINYLQIFVRNSRYDGPKSDIIEFKMPRKVSCPIESFDAFPLGSMAFLLRWKTSSSNVTGYKISYEEANGGIATYKTLPKIENPHLKQMKTGGMKAKTKYRFHIVALTDAGEGER